MPLLTVPGAELFYEVHGSGPILVLIPGAGGSGNVFHRVVKPLSTDFTVVTYDRRGHSQSLLNGEQDYEHRLERDADDVAELIQHIQSTQDNNKDSTAYVLGNSSGAIVTCAFVCRHPSLVRKVVLHEPPMMHALPEPESELDEVRKVYNLYRAKGVHAAIGYFSKQHLSREDAAAMLTGRDPRKDPYAWGNMLYWFERELLIYPIQPVPWSELEKPEVRQRVIMGVSEKGSQNPAARVAVAMGKRLELDEQDIVTFPGAHLGFLTNPEEFAPVLQSCLTR